MWSGTKNGIDYGFYFNGNGLRNAHVLTNEEHRELLDGQRDGKVIKWRQENDYYPTLEDADPPPEPTVEELAASFRADRDAALLYSDRYMMTDFSMTEEQRRQVLVYRQRLRDITLDENFPNVGLPVDPIGK